MDGELVDNVATLHEATSSWPRWIYEDCSSKWSCRLILCRRIHVHIFFCSRHSNAIVGVDFDWCGGCLYPDDCSIDFVLWELIWVGPQEVQWVKISEDEDAVSLTGLTATGGPYDASASCSTYWTMMLYYIASLWSSHKRKFSCSFFTCFWRWLWIPCNCGTPRVTWHQGKVIY